MRVYAVLIVVYAALVLVLLGLGCSNRPSADVPITAQLVLERGQEAVQSLKFFRGEYHFRLAKGDGGSLEETVIEAVVDIRQLSSSPPHGRASDHGGAFRDTPPPWSVSQSF